MSANELAILDELVNQIKIQNEILKKIQEELSTISSNTLDIDGIKSELKEIQQSISGIESSVEKIGMISAGRRGM